MVNYQYIVNTTTNKGKTTKSHYHSSYELVFYYHAQGDTSYVEAAEQPKLNKPLVYSAKTLNENSNRFTVKDNRFVIYEPYVVHNEKLVGSSKVFAIVFDLPDALSLKTCSFEDADGTIQKYADKILKEYENKLFGFNFTINALLTELVIYIKRKYFNLQKEDYSINQAINYINDYFTDSIDFNQLAQSIGYSVDHFRVLFKKQTGFSPKKYILDKRLDLAKKQLLHSDAPLIEISQICGYNDYYQFTTFFKKSTGVSPKKYRQTHSEN